VFLEAMRGGMTTGCDGECMAATGIFAFGSEVGIVEVVVLLFKSGGGLSAACAGRGEGGLCALREPIFSGLVRGDGGEGWR